MSASKTPNHVHVSPSINDNDDNAPQSSSLPMGPSITAVRRTKQILHQLANHHHPTSTISAAAAKQMPASAPSAAPWRSAFLSHIEEMDSPSFSLSTLHPDQRRQHHQHHQDSYNYVPRVRTVIFRGMWASLPVNPKNPAALNPDAFVSDMPTITTDVRMEKVPEVLVNSGTVPVSSSSLSSSSSAVGGPFEAVLWATKSQTQWRLRGFACVVGPDIESDDAAPVRAALQAHMRKTGQATPSSPSLSSSSSSSSSSASWSWSRELTAHFGNLSPMMRGSFRNPPPGTPVTDKPHAGSGLGLGQTVQDLDDETARLNFRVMVLVPEEVERLDLSDPKTGRRWIHTLDSSGAWQTAELWP